MFWLRSGFFSDWFCRTIIEIRAFFIILEVLCQLLGPLYHSEFRSEGFWIIFFWKKLENPVLENFFLKLQFYLVEKSCEDGQLFTE